MSLLAQAGALGATLLAARTFFHEAPAPIEIVVLMQAVVAAIIARLLKLSLPWQALNAVLVPGIVTFQSSGLPTWLAIAGLVLSLIIYVPTFWTHVPFYPTSRPMYVEILNRLPQDREFTFIDLGCGYGTLLLYLARHRPQGTFHGSEIAPLPYAVARLRSLIAGRRLKIMFKSFWTLNFRDYDFLYAFLAPSPMPKLWEKVKSEAAPGARFFVNTFKLDAPEAEQVTVQDKHACTLYVYDPQRQQRKNA
jgi:SAM-dependent methyltransferase